MSAIIYVVLLLSVRDTESYNNTTTGNTNTSVNETLNYTVSNMAGISTNTPPTTGPGSQPEKDNCHWTFPDLEIFRKKETIIGIIIGGGSATVLCSVFFCMISSCKRRKWRKQSSRELAVKMTAISDKQQYSAGSQTRLDRATTCQESTGDAYGKPESMVETRWGHDINYAKINYSLLSKKTVAVRGEKNVESDYAEIKKENQHTDIEDGDEQGIGALTEKEGTDIVNGDGPEWHDGEEGASFKVGV